LHIPLPTPVPTLSLHDALPIYDDDPYARYEAMQDLVVRHLREAAGGSLDDARRTESRDAIAAAFSAVLADTKLDDQMRGELMILDRKSTRLNSSHVKISYAVFC